MNPQRVIETLNDLIALDFDAIATLDTARHRVERDATRLELRGLEDECTNHVRRLSRRVRHLGGSPRTSGDARQVRPRGRVVIAEKYGDGAVLDALSSHVSERIAAYQGALSLDLDGATRDTLEANLADVREQASWLERLAVPPPDEAPDEDETSPLMTSTSGGAPPR